MEKNSFARLIAQQLNLQERAVGNTLALLDEGCTIPFISRYRKERTGGLTDVEVAEVKHWADVFEEMEKRKASILKTIAEQDQPPLSDRYEILCRLSAGVPGSPPSGR